MTTGAVFLAGCGSRAVDRWADSAIEDVATRPAFQYVSASCDGGSAGARCGLLVPTLASAEFREGFRERACAEKTAEECQSAYDRFVDARLADRYFAASWKRVTRHCDAHPPQCDDPTTYELLLVRSHNDAIHVRRSIEVERIEKERDRRQGAGGEATAASLLRLVNEVGYVAHQGPKCRSYPSVATGALLTTCSR